MSDIDKAMELIQEVEWKDEYGDVGDGMGPGHIATVGIPTGKMVPRNKEAYGLATKLQAAESLLEEAYLELYKVANRDWADKKVVESWLKRYEEWKGESEDE